MATFGKTDNSGSNQTNITVDQLMVSSGSPASSGTVTKLSFYCWVASTSTVGKAVIYSDKDGQPNSLLAVSDETTISSTSNTNLQDFNFSGANQISITASTTYWIGIHIQDPGATNFSFKRDNTANLRKRTADAYGTPPNPFGSPTNDAGKLACYVTYTESGVGVETATYSALPVTATIPSMTATALEVDLSSYSPLSITATIPPVTASYAEEDTPSYTALPVTISIPAITATSIEERTASYDPLSIVMTIPSFTVTFEEEVIASYAPLNITATVPSMTASSLAEFSATYTPLSVLITISNQSPTNDRKRTYIFFDDPTVKIVVKDVLVESYE